MTVGPAGPGPSGGTVPAVLVAHGSADPRAAQATEALARAVGAARPGLPVVASYLDHREPRPGEALADLAAAGHRQVVLVPLLLTAAYHGRIDIPRAVAAARTAGLDIPVRVAEVLGPTARGVDPLLLAGLRRRLAEADRSGSGRASVDAVVLAAAGTRDAVARRTVDEVAGALGAELGVPVMAGYASAAPPTAGAAVARLRAHGAQRVGVAAYFLAPGQLYATAMASAREAGAVAFAAPLGDAVELARLVLARVDAALTAPDDVAGPVG